MEASLEDLCNKMNDILKALERNEDIKICYRGKIKGTIKSMLKTQSKTKKVCDHPFFNCLIDDESVSTANFFANKIYNK